MTLAEYIVLLQEIARIYGDDLPVKTYSAYMGVIDVRPPSVNHMGELNKRERLPRFADAKHPATMKVAVV